MSNAQLSVIVPYFQRDRGILRRALRSVQKQDTSLNIEVLVVDDGSLAPPDDELAGLDQVPRRSIRLLRRPNGGPGAARNTGLDRVAEGTRFVAFLDSDDMWSTDHLSNAITALETGLEVYFADHYQLGQAVSAFSRAKRISADDHPSLPGFAFLHRYVGDMTSQIVAGNLIGTSTVVYDYRKFSALRFRPEFRNAGEDYLFWLELARAGAKFSFSTKCEATYGRGVNVYSGSGWGSDGHTLRIHNEMRYRKVTREEFQLCAADRAHVDSQIRLLRRAFLSDTLHRVSHGKRIDWPVVVAHVRHDPMTLGQIPSTVLNALIARIRR